MRAALRLVDAMRELNERDPTLDLSIRVGVNTGEVLVSVGDFADGSTVLVLGDVVNTAARIQTAAPVGAVAVSDQTRGLTAHLFVYEQLAPAAAKGKADPLRLWRALEVRRRPERGAVRPSETPFVGREEERRSVAEIFERAAGAPSTSSVLLVGEPGAGKSRLVAQLRFDLGERARLVRWLQGRCLPYGNGITMWALGEIVKGHAGIFESDAPELATEKLEAVLPDVEEKAWLRARLLPLVGVDSGQPPSREESFAAWRRFLLQLAEDRPAVVVIEDLHWADQALLDFLDEMNESADPVPLLLICTARPEFVVRHPDWEAKRANLHAIRLLPLSDDDTATLVGVLLEEAPTALQRLVLERAEGNPLYAEELARLIVERDDDAVGLPDNLQSLIAARLDLLAPAHKRLLQDAAVVGKVFWAGALEHMSGSDTDEVARTLHELAHRELVRPVAQSSMQHEPEYAFWHALVRDVAYGQIPRGERAHRHRAAATWIEQKAAGRVEDAAEVLAHHYVNALELARAVRDGDLVEALTPEARRVLVMAAERAIDLNAVQAEAWLEQALELSDVEGRPNVLLAWADAALQAGRDVRKVAATLEDALPALRLGGTPELAARALLLLSRAAFSAGEARQLDLSAEAVATLEAVGPSRALVDALTLHSTSQRAAGSVADALATVERAIGLARTLGLPVSAKALAARGSARAELGQPEGVDELERAVALMVEQGVGRDAAIAMNNLAYYRFPFHGHRASLAALEEGLAFARARGLSEAAVILEGNMLEEFAALGRHEQFAALARRSAAAAAESADTYSLAAVRFIEARILTEQGEHERALEIVAPMVEFARASELVEQLVQGLAAGAIVHAAAGDSESARALLVELETTPGARNNLNYPSYLPAVVRAALAANDLTVARQLAEGVEDTDALRACALLSSRAQLAEAAGDHFVAAEQYAEAAERWRLFGDVREQAFALLGQGRSLHSVHDSAAAPALTRARDLLATLQYLPAAQQAERLLAAVS